MRYSVLTALSILGAALANPVPEPIPDVTLPVPGGTAAGAPPLSVSATASNLGVGSDGKTTWRIGDAKATATFVADASNFALVPITSTVSTLGTVVTAHVAASCGLQGGSYNCVLDAGGNGLDIKITTQLPPTSIVYAGSTDVAKSGDNPSGGSGGSGSGSGSNSGALKVTTIAAMGGGLLSTFLLGFLLV